MKKVAQILRSKTDPTVHTIVPTASMFDALKLMAEKNIGALLIMEGCENPPTTGWFHGIDVLVAGVRSDDSSNEALIAPYFHPIMLPSLGASHGSRQVVVIALNLDGMVKDFTRSIQ